MLSKFVLAAYVLATSAGLVVLKIGATSGLPISFVDSKLQFNLNPYSILGIVLYGVSFLLYIYLISKFSLGYIIPLTTALVYVLIFVASFVIFKESFTATKVAAIALIICGLVLLNVSK